MRALRLPIILALVMVTSSVAGFALRPTLKADHAPRYRLEEIVPAQFGEWKMLPDSSTQVVNPQTEQLLNKLYSQILARTYVNAAGYQIMLSLAYGDDQRGGLQAHQPEVCYPAQGFTLLSNVPGQSRHQVRKHRRASPEHALADALRAHHLLDQRGRYARVERVAEEDARAEAGPDGRGA